MKTNCKGCGITLNIDDKDRTHSGYCYPCRKERSIQLLTPDQVLPASVPKNLVLKMTESKENQKTGLKEFKGSCFLYGEAGRGKSHVAACLMYEHMRPISRTDWHSCAWANVPKLLYQLRRAINNVEDRQEEQSIVDFYSNASWLCLDDLGAEKTSDWVQQVLYLIINERYENMRTTVFTSNMCLNGLASKMEDERLSSRITGMCEGRIWEIKGKDRRQ